MQWKLLGLSLGAVMALLKGSCAELDPTLYPLHSQMLNRISELGPEIAMGRDEGLHTSGHAYRDELEEALRMVRPQHFLPVHGEYAFLCAHAQLARDNGVRFTSVIRNGELLGVHDRRNGRTLSTGSMAMLGEAALVKLYNDGKYGTGSANEMAMQDRQTLAVEGIVIAAVDVLRDPAVVSAAREAAGAGSSGGAAAAATAAAAQAAARRRLRARVRVTTRAMWIDGGRLLAQLHSAAEQEVAKLPGDAPLVEVERTVAGALRRTCKAFNAKRPEVVVIAHEYDPRAGVAARAEAVRRGGAAAATSSGSSRQAAGNRARQLLPGQPDRRRRRPHAMREQDLLFAGGYAVMARAWCGGATRSMLGWVAGILDW